MGTDSRGLPDFLILGAPKAGTTAIYQALKQHPDVFMPAQKELRYFAFAGVRVDANDPVHRNVVTDLDSYRQHFSGAQDSQLRGEASPGYLSSEAAPLRIKETVPGARMIAILRNPVDRAFSHFLFAIQQGYEPRDAEFLEALREPFVDHRGFRRRRPYVSDSSYGKSLSRYLRLFDRSQIHLIKYEELKSDPTTVLARVAQFLGVDGAELPPVQAGYAASGVPKNARWHMLLRSRWVSKPLKAAMGRSRGEAFRLDLIRKNLHKPELSGEERALAYEFFDQDVRELEGLIGWDCGDWGVRTPPRSARSTPSPGPSGR